MDVLLEYIDLQSYFSQALPIMLDAFSYLLCSRFYAGIIGWSLYIMLYTYECTDSVDYSYMTQNRININHTILNTVLKTIFHPFLIKHHASYSNL